MMTEALIYNDNAISRVRKGEPMQTLISDLNGNKLYLNRAMDRIAARIEKKARGLC